MTHLGKLIEFASIENMKYIWCSSNPEVWNDLKKKQKKIRIVKI